MLPAIERGGPIEAWIINDTGFRKKGRHSVGVTRQYCGQLGKQNNCQVAVSLSLANHDASLPVAYRLYLPEDWAKDQARRDKAKVPQTIAFQTKPEIALEQIKAARTAGLPQGVVLMDAGYGNDTSLRTKITTLGITYVAGIGPNTSVWPAGSGALPARPGKGVGRPPKLLRRDEQHQPISVKALALDLSAQAWQTIHVARGRRGPARFALCTAAGAAGASRYQFGRAARGRVAAHRVAAERNRADEILVLHIGRGCRVRPLGRSDQAAMADRTRLSGAQTRAWPWRL